MVATPVLRREFDLACRYSGQELSYQKMKGQLSDAGNTTTLAHYLHLLEGAGMVCGFTRLQAVPELWGRMVESAVGAELLARHLEHTSTQPLIHYWRNGTNEVDYVLRHQGELWAYEVKSGSTVRPTTGLNAFCAEHPSTRPLVIGTGGLPLESWFNSPFTQG